MKPKLGNIAMDFKEEMKRVAGKYVFDGPTIIYCQTKKKTEEVTNALTGLYKFFFILSAFFLP